MSDFGAKISAIIDTKDVPRQLKSIEKNVITLRKFKLDTSGLPSEIQASLDKHKFKINLDGIKISDIDNSGIQKTVNEVSKAYSDLLKLQTQIGSIRLQINGLDAGKNSNQISELSGQLNRLMADYNNIYQTFSKGFSTDQLDNLNRAFETTSNKISAVNAKMSDTASVKQTESAYKELLDISKKISSLDIRLGALNAGEHANEISTLESRLSDLRQEYQQLRDEFDGQFSSSQLANLSSIVFDTDEKLSQLNSKIADTKAKFAEQISLKVDSGSIELSVEKANQRFEQLKAIINNLGDDDRVKSLKDDLSGLESEFKKLHELQNTFKTDNMSDEKLISAYDDFNKTLQSINNSLSTSSIKAKQFSQSIKDVNTEKQTLAKSNTLSNDIESWMNNNKAAAEQFGDRLREIQAQLHENTDPVLLKRLSYEFANIKSEAKSAGLTVNSFGSSLKSAAMQFLGISSGVMVFRKVFQEIKKGCETVVELDTALIDLKKTSTASASELKDFFFEANEMAKQLGVTTKEIIQGAADWSRLGYNIDDAKTMSRVSAIFNAISPDIDIETATDALVSAMKAFDIEAEDALDEIASKINIIGNTQAVSNGDIVDIITRASSAMAEANNSLEDMIALGTAATEITRDASSVGTALRTISMRIRGYDEETEEYIGGIEELSGDIANLTKSASNPGGISLFTDESKTEYKSTIQILRDISEIYDELTDKQQAALLEKLGGKRGGQVIAAILKNFDAVESSLVSMSNSAGNAMNEMGIIEQSLEYKLNSLKETAVGVFQNLFQSEEIGIGIELLTKILELIDFLTEHIGLLGTAIVSAGIYKAIKSIS